MSHFFRLKTEFKDAGLIRNAAEKLGFHVEYQTMCKGYNGIETRCDLVVKLPSGYDLGFHRTTQGYEVEADFFSNYISRYLGIDDPAVVKEIGYEQSCICKFTDAYNRELIEQMAMNQGYMVTENTLEDGSIELELVQCY